MLASAEYDAMADSGNTITDRARLPGGRFCFPFVALFGPADPSDERRLSGEKLK